MAQQSYSIVEIAIKGALPLAVAGLVYVGLQFVGWPAADGAKVVIAAIIMLSGTMVLLK